MKLSISNIGWSADQDRQVYELMAHYGFTGLEIAPTRILPQQPYDRVEELVRWYQDLHDAYGLKISSMQSIWYGRQEKLFGSHEERAALLDYTKKAIDFASAVGCGNLVFGCPRNRQLPEGQDPRIALPFFRELGDYAAAHGTVLAMEANPPLYDTNYINDTSAALQLIAQVGSPGFLLNLDVGTMLCQQEDPSLLADQVDKISHVHISEPGLKNVQPEHAPLHEALIARLSQEGYDRYISIEIGRQEALSQIQDTLRYVRELVS